MRVLVTLACVALLVIAGCSASPNSTPTTTPASTKDVVEEPSPTPTPTETIAPENPWSKRTVTIALDQSGWDRNYSRQVLAGVEYWTSERMDKHADYTVNFSYIGSDQTARSQSDITVQIEESLLLCGYSDEIDLTSNLGCSPLINQGDDVTPPVTIEMLAGQSDTEFNNTMKHELGHILGIDHGGSPEWLMTVGNGTGTATDAIERENPWNHSRDIRIAVRDGTENEDAVQSSLERAADYYNNHPEYLPEETGITVVDEWYRADVVFQDESPEFEVSLQSESIPYTYGKNWDSDQSLEEWEIGYVYLSYINTDNMDYHTHYWVGYMAGNDEDALPSFENR